MKECGVVTGALGLVKNAMVNTPRKHQHTRSEEYRLRRYNSYIKEDFPHQINASQPHGSLDEWIRLHEGTKKDIQTKNNNDIQKNTHIDIE